jgi:hypothetical protein
VAYWQTTELLLVVQAQHRVCLRHLHQLVDHLGLTLPPSLMQLLGVALQVRHLALGKHQATLPLAALRLLPAVPGAACPPEHLLLTAEEKAATGLMATDPCLLAAPKLEPMAGLAAQPLAALELITLQAPPMQ